METYNGHVRTPQDAIILFEACRIGMLPRVQRRLSEKERQSIRSGSVFVWDEREAGMRRWTDGKSWSASRVSGSFLTYREMEGKRGGTGFAQPTKTPESGRNSGDDGDGEEGPDGYRYKPDGLVKQSFSITTSTNQHLHLISYYSRSHPNPPGLQQPSTDPALRTVRPTKGLYPESTVHDQQSVPAVTRSPMAGAVPSYSMPPQMPPGYPRPGAAHPHGYAYAPSPPQGFPTSPMPTPPNGYGPYYGNGYSPPPHHQSGLPPIAGQPYPMPQYSPHPPIPVPQPPPNSLDQRPSRNEDSNSVIPPPPPPPPRHPQYPSRNDQLQSATRFQPPPQALETRSPQPPAAPIDPRLMGTAPPPAPTITQTNDNNNPTTQPSSENRENQSEDPPRENGVAPNPATQAAKIDALVHTASAEESRPENGASTEATSDRPASMSPGGTPKKVDGPADIPSQKLAFGEDKRALKALDKVFI
jgi:Gti1/Pac2 family transcription factor